MSETIDLWVDDERTPPKDTWVWVNHPDIAIWHLQNHQVHDLALDHDLGLNMRQGHEGEEIDTRAIVMYLVEHPEDWPTGQITVHTSNPWGREWLEGTIKRYAPDGQ